MGDDERGWSRRSLLAAVAAGTTGLAGCNAFTGATRGGPVDSGDIPDDAVPGDLGGGGDDSTTVSATESPTASRERTTRTPTEAPPPTTENLATPTVTPSEQVRVVDTAVDVNERRVRARATVRNVGSLVFSRLETRLNLIYVPIGDPEFVADFEYIDTFFRAGEEYFTPDEEYDLVAHFPFPIDERIRQRTADRFEVGAVIRRWTLLDRQPTTTDDA